MSISNWGRSRKNAGKVHISLAGEVLCGSTSRQTVSFLNRTVGTCKRCVAKAAQHPSVKASTPAEPTIEVELAEPDLNRNDYVIISKADISRIKDLATEKGFYYELQALGIQVLPLEYSEE